MTSTQRTQETAVRDACRRTGLSTAGLEVIRQHATGVYLLPTERAVARVRPAAESAAARMLAELLRWLIGHGFPVVEPLAEPVEEPPYVVTLWSHYPQPTTPPPAGALGGILRELHCLPEPPVALPSYQPLASLTTSVKRSHTLETDECAWLVEMTDKLLYEYRQLDFPLGRGLIHGDAYPGNTLWDGEQVRLGDWDEVAVGPRELDLANTFQGVRYGRTAEEIQSFTDAYGHDPSPWPGLRTLVTMRDLHTLGSFIQRADTGDQAAAAELRHRLDTLRSGRPRAQWGRH
ncbi:phosphotransferase family protein [Streptomyces qinzhouensis]|uniref:Phosphotransferase n=1 Tax=Streptomyces qinzhouensis TaxID=2599401 RepID=A0A5B8IFP6_9ACTN|nr:phosphotransferase [Streptomyces qinzhouensis]QDY76962.1 phosphotransferase [Streptomyces qinzhouensis]